MKLIKRVLSQINESTKTNIDLTQPQYTVFGLFQLLYIPLASYLNNGFSEVASIDIFVRSMVLLCCACLAVHSLWPMRLKIILPYFWYVTMILSLPFLNTFLMLRNYASLDYIVSLMLASLLMVLIIDWLRVVIFTIIGMVLAYILFYFVTPSDLLMYQYYQGGISFIIRYPSLFILFFAMMIVAMIFSRSIAKNRENMHLNQQYQAMQTVAASIAHELRTPLTTIQAGIKTANDYLPKLLANYVLPMQAQNGGAKEFDPIDISILRNCLEVTTQEIMNTHKIINMLLINLGQINIEKDSLEKCNIYECIKVALDRYPFLSEEDRQLIFLNPVSNFVFVGDSILLIHIIFNLLKNALYFIHKANKGSILITIKHSQKCNLLIFKDTGQGIKKENMSRIFNQFFTDSSNGSGVGLAFCKKAMQKMHGDITCKSIYGNYTEFTLTFPKVEKCVLK